MTAARRPRAAFYCASDSNHLPGLVAVLNSLRLHGHSEEFVVLDAGLRPRDRELLRAHARVAPAGRTAAIPFFRKYDLPAIDADVHVVLDADLIVTHSLDDLIERASNGQAVFFADDLGGRFHHDWERLLDLGPLAPTAYVNAGFMALPTSSLGLFDLVLDRMSHVDFVATLYGGGSADAPFLYCDQDVLNAVLCSGYAPATSVLDHRFAPHPPFTGVVDVDLHTATCRYADGSGPYLLHHVLAKPWLARTRSNVYARLLRRLLLARDVDLPLPPALLPLRLRAGARAAAARAYAQAEAFVRAQRIRVAVRSRFRDRRRGAGARTAVARRSIS